MEKVVTYTDFISKLREMFYWKKSVIYLPTREYQYKKVCKEEDISNIPLNYVRMNDSIKNFFFKPKEDIFSQEENVQTIVVGVKSCDLAAIKVLDNIFITEDNIDLLYHRWREKTILISSDCIQPQEYCFCNIVKKTPYPISGYDINISFIDENNFILTSGSKKGDEILTKFFSDYDFPTKNDVFKRDSIRNSAERKVKMINSEFIEDKDETYYKIVNSGYETEDVWKKESSTCVQCLGCNFICPSCYCFFIRENSVSYKDQFRDRVWDSCHSTGYGRVAGGANPRKYKFQRFRNRYFCKFVYRKENFGFYGCTGCGRCITVCPGKIDIRKVVRNLLIAEGEKVLKI